MVLARGELLDLGGADLAVGVPQGEGLGAERLLERAPGRVREQRALDARLELDDAYRERLQSMLTPEQVAQLPQSRRQMLKQFDKDGDGALNDSERRRRRDPQRSGGGKSSG